MIVRFFACCEISFHVVENLFFMDLLHILCLGYYLPSRNTLLENMLNAEILHITTKINLKINEEKYLTLGLDGWTNSRGQSLYEFVLITKDQKEYLYSVQNLSNHSHTGNFLAEKIIEIIKDIGAERFVGIVSDNASTIVMAKRLVNE